VNNSIVWKNEAESRADLFACEAFYSCSPNLEPGVNGNITNIPALISFSHVAADSPCRGAGSTSYISETDIDGDAWLSPPSMGCDELSEITEGSIRVEFDADYTGMLLNTDLNF
jgi:hypothetical protein